MFTTITLVITCLILYIWKLSTDKNYWQKRHVPFLKTLPIVGNALDAILLRSSLGDLMRDLYFKSDAPIFGIWIMNKPQLIIKSPELIKQVLVKDFNYFGDRFISSDEDSDEFAANMLFFMKHPKWKFFRTNTTPLLSTCKMKMIFSEMQNITKNMVDFINTNPNTNSLNVSDILVKFTTQVAYAVAFGLDSKSFQKKDTPFVSLERNIFTITALNALSTIFVYCKSTLVKIFKIKIVDTVVANFLKEIFAEIEGHRKLEDSKRGDIMDFLIKFRNANKLGDNAIAAQMAQFLVAGYDSTNTTISLALYELALNKHIQDKLREEIYVNLDKEGEVSYDTLNVMEYLNKVVYETLRKYPVGPIVGRTCTKDYKIPNTAIVIEKGVEVIISLSGLHNDPKYYPEPDIFDPERFSKENIRKRDPYLYLPFGKGPRNCVGERLGLMLVKLGIVHVIKSFEIKVCNETTIPLQFNPRKFTLSVTGGVYVQFVKLD